MPAIIVPVDVSMDSTTIVGGGQVNCTITLNQAAGASCSVVVSSNNQGVITSPSGSWPYQQSITSGATQVTFAINTKTVTQQTVIQIYAVEYGANITQCVNWRVLATLIITP